jgi:hypothetical protein
MNFSFTLFTKIVLKITSCASGVTGFEKTNNNYNLGFEPRRICVVLVVPKVFLLGTFVSSFEYHQLMFWTTTQ